VAGAEALVGLLQGDHVGGDLADHLRDPAGVEAAVDADAFMDVVGGDQRAGGAPVFAVRQAAGAVPVLAQRGDDAGGQALFLLLHRCAGSGCGAAPRGGARGGDVQGVIAPVHR
jgi:hypothetical protein